MGRTARVSSAAISGVVAAESPRKLLPASDRADHSFAPSLLWLMTSQRKPVALTCPQHLANRGMEFRRGISDAMLRVSVGLEDADDLIRDLEQALQ